MKKVKLIQFMGKDSNERTEVFGMKSLFLDSNFWEGNKLIVDYHCFNLPLDFLILYKNNRKPSIQEKYNSEFKDIFLEGAFNYLNWKYNNMFDSFEEFIERDKLLLGICDKYFSSGSSGFFDSRSFLDELNKYPYKEMWSLYSESRKKFILSDFNIKYNEKARDMVYMFGEEFKKDKFDFEGFNQKILNIYGLFIPKLL